MKAFKRISHYVKCLSFIMFFVVTDARAQLTHNFTQTAHVNDGGAGFGVLIATDGTVFLANYDDGLRAYTYDDTSFTNTAHIDDGVGDDAIARGVAAASGGTVFLANGADGLRAYRYDGTSFTNTAHIDDGGFAQGLAVADDSTVFLASGGDGLRAYRYDGTSFTNTAHVDDGGENIRASDVTVATDGTIFLANGFDGLRVYRYDGTSFSSTAHDSGSAQAVAVASDSTVFVAGCRDLRAYSYNGTSLNRIAQIEYTGCPTAGALALALDGTVFLAIAADVFVQDPGLWAYNYDNISFTNTAHINPPDGFGLAVAADGTVFLAGRQGLFAFTYDIVTGIDDNLSSFPKSHALWQNYPNPFNPSTTIRYALPQATRVRLVIYDILGREINTLVDGLKSAGEHQIAVDMSGSSSGVYFFRLQAAGFNEIRKMIYLR